MGILDVGVLQDELNVVVNESTVENAAVGGGRDEHQRPSARSPILFQERFQTFQQRKFSEFILPFRYAKKPTIQNCAFMLLQGSGSVLRSRGAHARGSRLVACGVERLGFGFKGLIVG